MRSTRGRAKARGCERASFVSRAKRSEKRGARARQSTQCATTFAPTLARKSTPTFARTSREVRAHDERVDARGDGSVFAERERPDAVRAERRAERRAVVSFPFLSFRSSAEKFVILHDGEEVRVRRRERAEDAHQTLRNIRRTPRERRGGPRPARVHPLGRVRERTIRRYFRRHERPRPRKRARRKRHRADESTTPRAKRGRG